MDGRGKGDAEKPIERKNTESVAMFQLDSGFHSGIIIFVNLSMLSLNVKPLATKDKHSPTLAQFIFFSLYGSGSFSRIYKSIRKESKRNDKIQ